MIKTISKLIIFLLLILGIVIFYLSYFGIETKRFNQLIKDRISKTNQNVDIELNKVKVILNLNNFTVGLNTIDPNIIFENKKIRVREIETNFSIKSFLNKEFAIRNLLINTRENKIKNVLSFIRLYKNSPQLFIFGKTIEEGTLKSIISLNFDNEGKIIDDYDIEGLIINTKMRLFNKQIINNINSRFKIKKNWYSLSNSNIEFKKIKLSSKVIRITKRERDKYYKIKGDFQSQKSMITPDIISIFLKENFKDLNFSDLNFSSDNDFEFKIDKKLKVSDIVFQSKIDLTKFIYKKVSANLKKYIPNYNNVIELNDHKMELTINKNKLTVKGNGKFLIDEKSDEINYKINSINGNYDFLTRIQFKNNPLKFEILDYKKSKDKNSILVIEGIYNKNKSINIKNLSFVESKNKFSIKDLNLNNNFKLNNVKTVDIDFINESEKYNKISLIRNKKNYKLNGKVFDASIIIDRILESTNNSDVSSIFNNFNSNVILKFDKTYIDKISYINNLSGSINFTNNKINQLNLESSFSNNKKITLSINTNVNNEKVTTLFSSYPKPLVKKYKFIKGFEDGVLDFYSIKKNNTSRSVLKIDNFKVKEIPVLAKLLTLASLQGIADLLTGEGIRFTDFEMLFSNKDKLMTIEEIYAIGPAISIMMSGYIESKELVSLRGTLVPATTINRTISSIPLIGDILIGKKVGEGVFGVSFKIKGPPKKLKTTVNPVKTLTPRFITRTLEKIKKNN